MDGNRRGVGEIHKHQIEFGDSCRRVKSISDKENCERIHHRNYHQSLEENSYAFGSSESTSFVCVRERVTTCQRKATRYLSTRRSRRPQEAQCCQRNLCELSDGTQLQEAQCR